MLQPSTARAAIVSYVLVALLPFLCWADCPAYTAPSNGRVEPATAVVSGASVTISCNTGYEFDGSGSLKPQCTGTTYEHGGSCRGQTCGSYPAPQHGTVVPDTVIRHPNRVTLSCENGYLLNTAVGSSEPQCLSDRSFSLGAVCGRSCGRYPPPQNGFVAPTGIIISPNSATLTCQQGYELTSGTADAKAQPRCLDTGAFEVGRVCTPISCGSYPFPPNSLGNGNTTEITFGQNVEIQCLPGYIASKTGSPFPKCLADGQFEQGRRCVRVCQVGELSATGLAPCAQCSPGMYAPEQQSRVCIGCRVGAYNVLHGASSCLRCEEGYSTPAVGSTLCQPQCPPGSSGPSGLAPCSLCARNFYNALRGAAWCMPCADGGSTSSEGASSRNDCIAPQKTAPRSVWTRSTSQATWNRRAWAGLAAIGETRMVLMGGLANGAPSNDVWTSVNPAQWDVATQRAPWAKRQGHAVISTSDRIWVLGGLISLASQIVNRDTESHASSVASRATSSLAANDVWSSTDGLAWEQSTLQAEWSARHRFAVAAMEGRVFLVGGTGGQALYNDVWVSQVGMSWTLLTVSAPFTKRVNHAAAVIGDRLVISGGTGISVGQTDDTWASVDGINWSVQTRSNPWGPRLSHAMIVYDQGLLLLGGSNGSTAVPQDSWFSTDGGVMWSDAGVPFSAGPGMSSARISDRTWFVGGGSPVANNDVWTLQQVPTQPNVGLWDTLEISAVEPLVDTLPITGATSCAISLALALSGAPGLGLESVMASQWVYYLGQLGRPDTSTTAPLSNAFTNLTRDFEFTALVIRGDPLANVGSVGDCGLRSSPQRFAIGSACLLIITLMSVTPIRQVVALIIRYDRTSKAAISRYSERPIPITTVPPLPSWLLFPRAELVLFRYLSFGVAVSLGAVFGENCSDWRALSIGLFIGAIVAPSLIVFVIAVQGIFVSGAVQWIESSRADSVVKPTLLSPAWWHIKRGRWVPRTVGVTTGWSHWSSRFSSPILGPLAGKNAAMVFIAVQLLTPILLAACLAVPSVGSRCLAAAVVTLVSLVAAVVTSSQARRIDYALTILSFAARAASTLTMLFSSRDALDNRRASAVLLLVVSGIIGVHAIVALCRGAYRIVIVYRNRRNSVVQPQQDEPGETVMSHRPQLMIDHKTFLQTLSPPPVPSPNLPRSAGIVPPLGRSQHVATAGLQFGAEDKNDVDPSNGNGHASTLPSGSNALAPWQRF